MDNIKEHPWIIAIIVAIVAGFGQLLASQEKLTSRIIIGRALSSGGLGMGAGSVFAFFPNADPIVMVGVAGILGSLGTSGIERLLQRVAGKAP